MAHKKEKLIYGRKMSFSEKRTYLKAAPLKPYEKIFFDAAIDYVPYYRSWMHDIPMIVSPERDDELRELSRILYKCCVYYISHYRDYLDLISFDEKVLWLLSNMDGKLFRAGTYRPDYLICADGSLKLCEITSRFFSNGYFLSFFTEYAAKVFAKKADVTDMPPYFEEMLAYFAALPQGKKRLVVLKSADLSDSIRLYVPFYQALGLEVTIVEAPNVEDHLHLLSGAFVVSALNQRDLLSYKDQTLLRLIESEMYNDFRTVFLLHDKRFFALFTEERFLKKCLTDQEALFLRAHTVTTYLPETHPEIWDDARKNKNRYILKHHCLGKSESVFAGPMTTDEQWEMLFSENIVQHMILQPFMEQKLFTTTWNSRELKDYVSGTILTVDDRYFGTGMFRSSTSPVINITDAHKIAPINTAQGYKFSQAHIL